MKKYTLIILLFLTNLTLVAQDKLNGSYKVKSIHVSLKCYYCGKECSNEVITKITDLSDYRLIGYLIDKGTFNDYKIGDCYSKCQSALNKSDKHDLREPKSENKTEIKTQICEITVINETKLMGYKSYFEETDFEKYKKYCLSLEKKDKESFDSEFDNLENLISNKEYEQAALLYTNLSNGKFANDAFLNSKNDIIQNGLNYSNTKIAIISPEELNRIILSNREYFKEMFKETTQNIEILFDQKGNGFINDVPCKIRNGKPFLLKEVGKFKVYCKSKGTFQLTTEQVQDPNKMYLDIWVAPNIKVIKNGKKYFKKTFLSASIFRDEVSVVNNDQVPSGKYWKVKHDLKLYKVNGTEIVREEQLVRESENNLSRRLGMKIARGTSSLAILTWLTLRFIEFSSVK
jgi:hypothetical protein